MTQISPGGTGPFDVTKIIKANPDIPHWGDGAHFWSEPELGYYLSYEKWVIRRHARQLSDAGVDVIIFDVTNDKIYPEVYIPVCEVFREMRATGERTPDIAFLGSEISVNKLWSEFYKKAMYPDLWFQWKGKPLLLFGQHEIPSRKKNNDVVFPEEIRNFFSIRESWAWTSLPWYQSCPYGKDKWPWVDHYPQVINWHESPDKAEMIPVTVAQHPLSNIGRSFHNFNQPHADKYDLSPYTDQGLCFEEQWNKVEAVYYDHIGDVEHRNSPGQGQAGPYVNTTGRNDIVTLKVAYDASAVYFYAETREALSPSSDPNWMLLFVDTDQNKETGWEGYELLINSRVTDNKTTTMVWLNKDGSLGKSLPVPYQISQNKLMIKVKRSDLSIQ